jgi:hypothetical protein
MSWLGFLADRFTLLLVLETDAVEEEAGELALALCSAKVLL